MRDSFFVPVRLVAFLNSSHKEKCDRVNFMEKISENQAIFYETETFFLKIN